MSRDPYPVTPERTAAYARLTTDFNPIHVDPTFAAATSYGRPIAHGTHALGRAWEAIAAAAVPDGLAGRAVSVRFLAPVFVGESLRVRHAGSDEAGGERFEVVAGAEERVAILATLAPSKKAEDGDAGT